MTSIWNENFSLFTERFDTLAKILESQIPEILKSQPHNANQGQDSASSDQSQTQKRTDFLNGVFPFYNFSLAKNGELTASEGGLALHSSYNPQAEAQKTAAAALQDGKDILVFAGIGLGWLPNAAAKIQGADEKTFIILEPEPQRFFAALASLDFSELFKIPKLFFAIGATCEQAASLVQCAGGFEKAKILSQKSQTAGAQEWFDGFFKRAKEQLDKAQVNTNTLEKFGRLWLKNGARNLEQMRRLGGAAAFFGAADFSQNPKAALPACESQGSLPSVLLAAGPSLEEILPHLRQIKDRAVTIAVDTALRACLRANVQPDFIVLTDPQYWASLHLAGLSAPQSILVAESAAYPSVFRFDCKQIVLMSSLFPLGKYIEARLGKKGQLASGGSVATSAWDFARAIGSKEIFAAGLDLGYPNMQTHIKGSAFEERIHINSSRLNGAESQSARILFSAKNQAGLDYDGGKIITDERMKLFAWWFERTIANDTKTRTFTFSKKGLAIKGIEHSPLDFFLQRPKITKQKKEFFERAGRAASFYDTEKFSAVLLQLKDSLKKIDSLAKKGIALCNDILCGDRRAIERIGGLDLIDKEILGSEAKNVAELVFPTPRQLERIFSATPFPKSPLQANAAKSKIIYTELSKSIEDFLKIC